MAARVIYFGSDDCHRVAVLRSAGYEVRESNSLNNLGLDLQRDEQIDAVIVSEDNPETAEKAVDLVREHKIAPPPDYRLPTKSEHPRRNQI